MKTAKRFMATAMAMVMCVAVLVGCGSSAKDDYLKDLQEFVDMASKVENLDYDDPDAISTFKSAINGMSVKTSEGKVIKSDLEDMVKVLERMMDRSEDDLDGLTQDFTELMEIMTTFSDHAMDLAEAAEKAGVEESDLASLGF